MTKAIFTTTIISILGFGVWLAYEPWFKLSAAFKTELNPPPKTFFKGQSCILGETRIRGWINIGIIEQNLYLSHTSPGENIIILQPLLINLDAITKIDICFEPLLNECYKFFIGDPHITTLVLAQDLIEKLEEDYGEPIFSNKLRGFS
ncbi:hypothetical protein [Pleurocapsa sp. PCC 7319]|uniref:hypothetical protein n=1 Tax=Pleurocapsa sp. PCC 7319 TaxID=118161 RepID=UPI001181A8EB|nr:hypothetical protein [Pleurocapsa sp. PCC 7319]